MSIMLLALVSSCETTNLELQANPYELTEESADANFVLNGIQTTFGIQMTSFSSIVEPLVDHSNLFGTFAQSAGTDAMNGVWQNTYSITSNLNFLESLSETNNLPQHVGVAQVLEAYSYVTLVDFIGAAVYSEAVNPEFENPSLDSGQSIYDAMYDQLDLAIANLKKEGSQTFEDLYYDGDTSKWIKLANSLKLRMYVQSKLSTPNVSALNAIVSAGNYIKEADDNFAIYFGTSDNNPDNRHPYFQQQYAVGTTAGNTFQSNGFMNLLRVDKNARDPRTPYYFYRQDLNDPIDEDIDQCDDNYLYCYLGSGYIGRDRGDDDGIPNNGVTRTAYGIYPGGGAYDEAGSQTEETNNAKDAYDPSTTTLTEEEFIANYLLNVNPSTVNSTNNGGEGIFPILTSSFMNFLLAEASLPAPAGLGSSGNGATLLENAMQESFDLVAEVSGIPMVESEVSDYIDEVITNFNAGSDEEKLEIIIKEYYIASFGNSVEAYNAYRRTGYPDLEAHVLPSGGDFIRSFFYPATEIDTNANEDFELNKKLTDQVFWDTNPAGFID
ncbi:SusD/RagB family nutrient-binding outer membrane lipoprotein [Thalassobellus sediminis]|uniref:SusD/RagB family nutrient-binding outer membrane lipoprotein n=1 Tax=Thalassobellus sediminis TaxID=3367753 RepID=UPI00378796FA